MGENRKGVEKRVAPRGIEPLFGSIIHIQLPAIGSWALSVFRI